MDAIPVSLIMLDLDGTLVDSALDLSAAIDQMLIKLDRAPVGEEKVRSWVGNGAATLVARALSGELHPDDRYTQGDLFDSAYELFLKEYAEANGRYAQIYPGVEAAIDRWVEQRIPLALITNKPMFFTNVLLKRLRLARHFHFILGGDSCEHKKPHPEPLLQVIEQIEAPLEQCWMVGDSVNDLEAARAAGAKIACVSYGYNHGNPIADANPDLLIDRLDQLPFVAAR